MHHDPGLAGSAAASFVNKVVQGERQVSIKVGPIFHVGYAVPDMDRALAYRMRGRA